MFAFIVVLNNLLRLGHKGRRTPVIHTEKVHTEKVQSQTLSKRMPLKDGDPNPTKTKSNCLCLPFLGHFLTPLQRVATTTSSCVCVCVFFFHYF